MKYMRLVYGEGLRVTKNVKQELKDKKVNKVSKVQMVLKVLMVHKVQMVI